ncbi:hypothetical protein LTR56_016885 [Elasticomyces elasticus]|nr:hypothetical protein LTR56_016885 [Elasticomyces elasticus]KAK3658654.1 hypothetical protein LTR22_008826 [Elasticomyces elasticus]KAK4913577.1 hypothetical protein LTR49_018096 [Elasticomyces elasticus]KAK5756591.1 hypothetical protein LTS12_013307 [Elasticomyces elasticus]
MASSREPSPFDARAYFDNPDWIELALSRDHKPVTAAPFGASANSLGWKWDASSGIMLCYDIDSIPTGRQASKNLKCGISGCTLKTLFDRKFELERHMRTHDTGNFPCPVHGCERNTKPFTRPDKLGEHVKKVHGQK